MSENNTSPKGEQKKLSVLLPGAAAKLNNKLERFMPILAPFGIVLGVFFPHIFINLRPYITLLFGVMTFTGALKLKTRDLIQVIKNPIPIILFFVTVHILMPLMVMLISRLVFGADADSISGFVLVYAVPTAVSGFIWVMIYRGNIALSLALLLLDTITSPLVVPATIQLLLGASVAIDTNGMIITMIYMMLIPTILGVLSNELSRGFIPRVCSPYLNPLSKICLMLVISANCSAVASQINFLNSRIWLIGAMSILFSVMGFCSGKITGLFAQHLGLLGKNHKEKQVPLFFGGGLRNISSAMTLGIEFFPPAAALPAVLGIVFQQSMAAFMGRVFMGKIPEDKTGKESSMNDNLNNN